MNRPISPNSFGNKRNNKTLFQWLTKCESCSWPGRNASGSKKRYGGWEKTRAGEFCRPCQNTGRAAVPWCDVDTE